MDHPRRVRKNPYEEQEKILYKKIKDKFGHEMTDYEGTQRTALNIIDRNYDITDTLFSRLCDPQLGGDRAWAIADALRDKVPINALELYADPRYSETQIRDLGWIFKRRRISLEQAALFLNPAFNGACMEEIAKGFEDGLSFEDVSLYANPAFTCAQMMEIHSGLLELPREKVLLFCKPELQFMQMSQIRDGLFRGKSIDDIEIYSYDDAKQIFDTYGEAFKKAVVDAWCGTDSKGLIDGEKLFDEAKKNVDKYLDHLPDE